MTTRILGGKGNRGQPKGQLPSYHLTTTANPLRTQPHSQSESVHNLGDNIHELLLVHTGAQEIRFQDAYAASLPADVGWHPGAQRFWKEEQEKLLITTGAITGLYYAVGKTMELLLEQSGIPARAIHTEGSVSNAFLLRDPRWKTLAFMQYDTALSAYLGSAGPVYGQGFTRELQVTDSNGGPASCGGDEKNCSLSRGEGAFSHS